MSNMTRRGDVPFIIRNEESAVRQSGKDYFDYPHSLQTIVTLLEQRFGCGMKLYYQEESNDVWDALEEDIRSGYEGIEHAGSVFDLVETRIFRYVSDADPEQGGYDIRPAVRNNLFVYPEYRVAFARIPRETQYGLGHEDIIFSDSDESLTRLLEDIRKRQIADRQMIVFTDTDDGLEQERKGSAVSVSRDDVFMDESLKAHIYRSVDEFFSKDGSFFRTYDIPYKRGILLYGKPGNGKTTLVKSISSTIDAPIAYWQITEHTSSDSIKEVFAAALRMAPMVLVIEDIDSMPEMCRSFFLNTLDGATSKEGIFLIGTTNYPERIDPALMNRAGRFDRSYEVKSPDEALRHAYLQRKGIGRFVDDSVLAHAARKTEGFTFAQLSELYVSAALQMHYENEVHMDKLIAEMKSDFSKGKTGDWISDKGSRSLGFV